MWPERKSRDASLFYVAKLLEFSIHFQPLIDIFPAHILKKMQLLQKKATKKQNKITSKTNKTITNINYNLTENYIAENIEYEALKGLYGNNSKALYILEQMYSVLVNDIYAANIKSVNYKGQVFSSSIVKAVFKKLNYNNIKYVIDKMLKLDSKINNIARRI